MITKEFIKLAIGDITPYANNPRRNDNAVEDVMQSVEQCGELDPIEIDENNVILSGHTRLKAYEQMGFDAVDCVRYTGLSEDQKRKYRLLANKTGEKALWDFDKLETELEGLDFGGWDFGFDEEDSRDKAEIKTVELRPYKKVHYLITVDVNDNDKIIELIEKIRRVERVEVESNCN